MKNYLTFDEIQQLMGFATRTTTYKFIEDLADTCPAAVTGFTRYRDSGRIKRGSDKTVQVSVHAVLKSVSDPRLTRVSLADVAISDLTERVETLERVTEDILNHVSSSLAESLVYG